VHVFGERLVGVMQDARVVAQPPVDAACAAPLRVDGKTRRQGERPLFEPLRAKQLVSERLVAIAFVKYPVVEEQMPSGNPSTVPEDVPLDRW